MPSLTPLHRVISADRPLLRLGMASLLCLSLAACAPMSTISQQHTKAADLYAAEQSFAAATSQWPTDTWWQPYQDSQLNTLITEALANSPSLAIAQARLLRAEAQGAIAGSALQPQLSGNGSITEQKQSYNYLTPANMTPEGWKDYGRATLDFSWEFDFWGKNRAALAAATSETAAAQADAAQARLTLATSVASAYAELARLYSACDTASAALKVRQETVSLVRQRYDHGLETLGTVHQVEARRASAEADLLSLDEQLALQKNRLAALLGQGPDRGLSIQRPTLKLDQPFGLPQQLKANLLGRRPDIVAARLRTEAAASRIKQSQAAFYPDINLSAFIGVQSLGLDQLLKSGSDLGSVGPAISLPIFNGGRLKGQLKSSEADYAEAVANYDQTLTQALQDVADAVTSRRALDGQLSKVQEAVDSAAEAYRIANNRYKGGLSNYLDVLSAEDTLLSNRRSLSDLQSRLFTLDVALVQALGGGYQASDIHVSQGN
ncbi:efflux transporter outer membrane subunit [Pokkaliibacter plantistimulans]|nr:efflux transporter outer membrane subunit [Pokkaliibacter plantistimulans]